jgi:hypothetical protein
VQTYLPGRLALVFDQSGTPDTKSHSEDRAYGEYCSDDECVEWRRFGKWLNLHAKERGDAADRDENET